MLLIQNNNIYFKDCVLVIVIVVFCGKSGEVYNIVNPDVACSIRKLAETIAECAGVQVRMEIPSGAEAQAFNPMNNSLLDASKLAALGWTAEYDIRSGIEDTIAKLKLV